MSKVSRETVRGWLEGYHALQAGETPLSEMLGVSGGPKPDDGIRGGQINRIMLDAALKTLAKQQPVVFFVMRSRFIEQLPVKATLSALGKAGRKVSKAQYYGLSEKGVDFIFYQVNGRHRGLEKLLKKLADIS